jgi:hypothetical protein
MPTVVPLTSPRQARFMANDVPGVYVPSSIMARIEDAADPQEEGIQIALDLITELKRLKGIHGLHILAPGQEEVVPRLVEETRLREPTSRPRPFSGNGRDKADSGLSKDADVPQFMKWLTLDPNNLSGTAYKGQLDL